MERLTLGILIAAKGSDFKVLPLCHHTYRKSGVMSPRIVMFTIPLFTFFAIDGRITRQKGGDGLADFFRELRQFFRKGDMVLLVLCLATSAFGTLIVASTNNYRGFARYVIIQLVAIALGVIIFAIVSSIDAEFYHEHRLLFFFANLLMLGMLIPFGVDHNTGNYSWLDFPFLPIEIMPAEICKIFYILIMASVMSSHQNRLNSVSSVLHMAAHLLIIAGANYLISRDLGVTLIFFFIFVGMAVVGGIKWLWWLVAGGGLVVVGPFLWNNFMSKEQRNRILYVFQPEIIDPTGLDEGWHTTQSLKSLTGGGLTGQGLFNGNRTQVGALNAQHTDFIFSAIGEELGFLGCLLVLILLFAIVARCFWVGRQSSDYMRRMICYGAASSLMFQIVLNVGMCIGVSPVIGLTLPFFSYGGSSMLTTFAMLGLVSGVCARPAQRSHERYIRPPR